ncbi:cyclopropane-fatty-acyl-phospholipid synthase family protein [Puniceicoccaceae bacterium K14]|nr:cyclopropane-fatty-acyl-phospholipid synthase family protein [Puniceicoccaceae bacterium K14]
MNTIAIAEKGLLPYWLLRMGIRSRVNNKLNIERSKTEAEQQSFIKELTSSQIAIDTDSANEQHYEVPTRFYQLCLGEHLKYSSAFWPEGCSNLNEAEAASLQQIAERAQLENGQKILDLGCGWGSFSLWAAKQYPDSTILSVSNSKTQAVSIREETRKRRLNNIIVTTCDINEFDPQTKFDRIVSVEMLEHVRNHSALFERISTWLHEKSIMFIHVFSHRKLAYEFDASNNNEWMAKYFFTGGIMPSHDLLPSFNKHLEFTNNWYLDGTHYEKTANAWLDNMNQHSDEILRLFENTYGAGNAKQWMWRWRLFYLSCAELFGYKDGSEWGVSHYTLKKRA